MPMSDSVDDPVYSLHRTFLYSGFLYADLRNAIRNDDRAKFHVHFPAHILKFLRTDVGKVQKSVQEILLYPELQEIQLFFQCLEEQCQPFKPTVQLCM